MRLLPSIVGMFVVACAVLAAPSSIYAFEKGAAGEDHHATKGASASGDHAGGHAHIGAATGKDASNIAEVRKDLAIFSFIVFLLLLGILGKFAWKPITEALERREHGIAENIAAAQRAGDDARSMLAEYETKLRGAADEVRGIMEEARRDAESTKQEIIAEAKAAAQQEHDRMLRDVNMAKNQALKELSETSANLAIDLAGRIVRAQLNKADHARLVTEALNRVTAGSPQAN